MNGRTNLTPAAARLADRLATGQVVLMDGGTGTEMERVGVPMVDGAWCGCGTITHPDLVQAVHESFIVAGAEVIAANTYASSRHVMEQVGEGDRFEEANRSAVAVAIAAREATNATHVAVAGSMSPTNQYREVPPVSVTAPNYREQALILEDAGADLLLVEMLRDAEHSIALLDGARATDLPIWMGWSAFRDADGDLTTAWNDKNLARYMVEVGTEGVDAVMLMHTEQSEMADGLDLVDQIAGDLPRGAYAQSGGFIPPNWVFEDVVPPAVYTGYAMGWIERGVQIVGGCCGITPDHIAHLRKALDHR